MNETREQRTKRWNEAGTSNSDRIDELLNEIDDKITELLDDGKLVIADKPMQKVPSFITQSTFINDN